MNTLFMLLAQYETGEIPLLDICEKYFDLDAKKACEKARSNTLPVPAFRCGSQKSQWLVSAQDLARLIDDRREQSRKDWEKINRVA